MKTRRNPNNRSPISFSIWLMPDGHCKKTISGLITRISDHLGGPIFKPHVTLIGGLHGKEMDLVKKAKTLSNLLNPFYVIFEKIFYLDKFFRSFFLQIKLTDELKSSRNIACNEFNYYGEDYFPHMSLAYGDFNKLTKIQMASEIGEIPNGFFTDKIFLAYNDEVNLHWEIIDYFELKS